jgi:hypothetical protein
MGRYQILRKLSNIKPIAYRFKSSNSINVVSNYIKKCITDKVSFDANNINTIILDPALVKVSKELDVPIVTGSEDMANIFSITHDIKVYSINNIPLTVPEVICYWDVTTKPKNVFIILNIIRK